MSGLMVLKRLSSPSLAILVNKKDVKNDKITRIEISKLVGLSIGRI